MVFLQEFAGLPPQSIPLALLAAGLAGATGLAIKSVLRPSTQSHLRHQHVIIAVLISLPWVASSASWWVAALLIVILGLAFGGVPVLIQTRMMHAASPGVRNLAASLQATAFNVGIGAGALIGGLLIDSIGLGRLPIGAGSTVALGLLVAFGAEFTRRRLLRCP